MSSLQFLLTVNFIIDIYIFAELQLTKTNFPFVVRPPMGHLSKLFLPSGLQRSFLNVGQGYRVVRCAATKYQEESWEKEIYTAAPIDKVSDFLCQDNLHNSNCLNTKHWIFFQNYSWDHLEYLARRCKSTLGNLTLWIA